MVQEDKQEKMCTMPPSWHDKDWGFAAKSMVNS